MLNGYKPNIRVGNSYTPLAEGAYICQIVDVNPVTGMNSYKGVEETKLNYQFAILDDIQQEDGSSSRNRFLWKRCSESMNEKSWLYKLYKAVLGRDPTKEELENFDAETLIGKNVKCLVDQKPSSDGATIWNNIISFSKADKKLEAVDFEPKPQVMETTTSGVQPIEDIDPDKIIEELEKDSKKK